MREIKFRAWAKEEKVMRRGFFVNYNGGTYVGDGIGKKSVHKDFILMQYTGLKDKLGKDIYESDVVLYKDKKREVKFCEYSDDEGYSTIFHIGWYAEHSLADMENKCEIIGNIYENPELIKK